MKRLLVVAALLTASAMFAQSEERSFVPTLSVSMGPYTGILPASLANGRPVYQFTAHVMDEEKNEMLARTRVLMQPGDTKTLKGKTARSTDELFAAVTLDGRGQARYRVEYRQEDRRVLASSAAIRLIE